MEALIVFDMDGVLAEVTESYRETIVQTVRAFHRARRSTRDPIQDYKNQGGWNNDWALSQKIAADLGVEVDYDTVVDYFNEIFHRRERRRSDSARAAGSRSRACWNGLARAVRPGDLHRPPALRSRDHAEAFRAGLAFDPMLCADDVASCEAGTGRTAEDPAAEPGTQALVRRRYGGRCALRSRGGRAVHRHRGARTTPGATNCSGCFEQENAVAVLENINEIERRAMRPASARSSATRKKRRSAAA